MGAGCAGALGTTISRVAIREKRRGRTGREPIVMIYEVGGRNIRDLGCVALVRRI